MLTNALQIPMPVFMEAVQIVMAVTHVPATPATSLDKDLHLSVMVNIAYKIKASPDV